MKVNRGRDRSSSKLIVNPVEKLTVDFLLMIIVSLSWRDDLIEDENGGVHEL